MAVGGMIGGGIHRVRDQRDAVRYRAAGVPGG